MWTCEVFQLNYRSSRFLLCLCISLLIICAMTMIYQPDLYRYDRFKRTESIFLDDSAIYVDFDNDTTATLPPFYVYDYPVHHFEYPTLFLAQKKDRCMPDNVLSVESGGRLCNIVLEYASAWSVAKLYNLTAFVPQEMFDRLKSVFRNISLPGIPTFMTTQTSCHSASNWNGELDDVIGEKQRIDLMEVSLDSAMQEAKENHMIVLLQICVIMAETIVPLIAELSREFRYQPVLEDHAQKTLSEFQEKLLKDNQDSNQTVLFVGIHVRRTDYKHHINLLYGVHEDAREDYYKRAVAWMRKRLSKDAHDQPVNVVFVVASDDPEWCQEVLIPELQGPSDKLGKYDVFWGGNGNTNSPEQDLALLSSCNHSIIAYGTYGIWSALMTGGHAVVYNVTKTRHGYSPAMQFARNLRGWATL